MVVIIQQKANLQKTKVNDTETRKVCMYGNKLHLGKQRKPKETQVVCQLLWSDSEMNKLVVYEIFQFDNFQF